MHGSDVNTSLYELWNRAGQKVDLLFSGPKLAHLAVQKFVMFCWSRVNKLLFVQNLPGPL